MANKFKTFPMPGTNTNAHLDVSDMARDKTIFISDNFKGDLYFEARAEAHDSGTPWVQVARAVTGQRILKPNLLARFMRVNQVKSKWQGAAPTVRMSSEEATVTFASLSNGEGGASHTPSGPYFRFTNSVDFSEFPAQKTIYSAGSHKGSMFVRGLVNNIAEVVARFHPGNPGYVHTTGIFEKMDVERTHLTDDVSELPLISIAAASELPGGAATGETDLRGPDLVANGGILVPAVGFNTFRVTGATAPWMDPGTRQPGAIVRLLADDYTTFEDNASEEAAHLRFHLQGGTTFVGAGSGLITAISFVYMGNTGAIRGWWELSRSLNGAL